MRVNPINPLLALAAMSMALCSCGKSSSNASNDGDTETAPTSSGTSVLDTNLLSAIYPGGLAISIFPDSISASGLTLTTDSDEKTLTMAAKSKETDAILKGERDCVGRVFQRQIKQEIESCYEFDQEMIYGKRPPSATYRGSRDGKNAKGEACLVAFTRTQVREVELLIDRALGVVQTMLCQAKKAGKVQGLPREGETIDLAATLFEAFGDRVSRISKAAITRIADKDGRPVYRSDVTMEGRNGETQETHLVHSPASLSDNNTYDGVLWTRVSGIDKLMAAGTQMQGGSEPKDPYMSVQYARVRSADKTQLKAQLLRARVVDVFAPHIFKNGVLDLNVGTNSTNDYVNPTGGVYQNNAAINGMTYIGLNVDPETGAGSVSYWQNPGANYTESARGMVFNLSADTINGSISGCGLTGARKGDTSNPGDGLSIRKALKEGKLASLMPNGFYHPFFNTESQNAGCSGPSVQGVFTCSDGAEWYSPSLTSPLKADWVSKQMGVAVSRQCVIQNAGSGLYEIDSNKISEASGFVLIDGRAPSDAEKVSVPDLTGLTSFQIN